MNLEDLTLREKHDLAAAVTLACVGRLEALTERSDPQDAPMQRLLESLAEKVLHRTEELERSRSGVGGLGASTLTRRVKEVLIRRHFPSLSWSLGEGWINREAGTYLAECLEEECAAFYKAMAEATKDPVSRRLFRSMGEQNLSFLEFVRHVLL